MWAYVAQHVHWINVACLQYNPLPQEPNLRGTSLIIATLLPGILPLLAHSCAQQALLMQLQSLNLSENLLVGTLPETWSNFTNVGLSHSGVTLAMLDSSTLMLIKPHFVLCTCLCPDVHMLL